MTIGRSVSTVAYSHEFLRNRNINSRLCTYYSSVYKKYVFLNRVIKLYGAFWSPDNFNQIMRKSLNKYVFNAMIDQNRKRTSKNGFLQMSMS